LRFGGDPHEQLYAAQRGDKLPFIAPTYISPKDVYLESSELATPFAMQWDAKASSEGGARTLTIPAGSLADRRRSACRLAKDLK